MSSEGKEGSIIKRNITEEWDVLNRIDVRDQGQFDTFMTYTEALCNNVYTINAEAGVRIQMLLENASDWYDKTIVQVPKVSSTSKTFANVSKRNQAISNIRQDYARMIMKNLREIVSQYDLMV